MSNGESELDLAQRLARAARTVEIGAVYEHHKRRRYRVVAIALDEETCESCVIYQAEYGDNLSWSRPLSSWLEQVEVDGEIVQRFTKIQEDKP